MGAPHSGVRAVLIQSVQLQPHGGLEQRALIGHSSAELIRQMPSQAIGPLSTTRNAATCAHTVDNALKHIEVVGADRRVHSTGNLLR